jgi:hypothetical protein
MRKTTTGETKNAYTRLVGKPIGKLLLKTKEMAG